MWMSFPLPVFRERTETRNRSLNSVAAGFSADGTSRVGAEQRVNVVAEQRNGRINRVRAGKEQRFRQADSHAVELALFGEHRLHDAEIR